jgi:hypothetical protein
MCGTSVSSASFSVGAQAMAELSIHAATHLPPSPSIDSNLIMYISLSPVFACMHAGHGGAVHPHWRAAGGHDQRQLGSQLGLPARGRRPLHRRRRQEVSQCERESGCTGLEAPGLRVQLEVEVEVQAEAGGCCQVRDTAHWRGLRAIGPVA